MTECAQDLTGSPSRRPATRAARVPARARPFLDGTTCCYCDLPVFGSQSPQNRGLGTWCHAGCRRGRPSTGIPVPLGSEVRSFLAGSGVLERDPADLQDEVEAWLYSFWLRRCPLWPSVLVRSGSPGEVGALLDEIEDAFDGCLWGREGAPVSSSSEEFERSFRSAAARFACFAPVAHPVPADRPRAAEAFDGWLREGHRLDFIVWAD